MSPQSRLPPDSSVDLSNRRGWSRLLAVLLVALLARLVAIAVWTDNLVDDRDGYLSLAWGLATGSGFSVPGTSTPTAYRPPLYPLVLMPAAHIPSGLWVGVLHVILGLLTVFLTARLARPLTSVFPELPCRNVALGAGLLVAVDPLLVRYATLPMTETLATFLVAGLLLATTWQHELGDRSGSVRRAIAVGVLFGLAALCRPTVWAFAALVAIWKAAQLAKVMLRRAGEGTAALDIKLAGWTLVAAAAIILPWVGRNVLVLGHPILMTTHGGYTLLLGNNPAFYREVVDQPWGIVWDGTHGGGQSAWVEDVNRQMQRAELTGEVERDRWMADRAWSHIAEHPVPFLRACVLRIRRFWSTMPAEGANDQPQSIRYAVGTFYWLVYLGAAVGLSHIVRKHPTVWIPTLLMIIAFAGVHLLYWSNARMRAPIMPAVAIISSIGWWHLRFVLFARRGEEAERASVPNRQVPGDNPPIWRTAS